ncbi:ABC transporter ATP-binding protein [Clostridium hydrogeniformans]|uniref:ABC transporter ATP-binding protein n=1 Tax=Clostridium hydrogeniformans TaxID=349933 RepID=UPI000488388B|nr:ABC transporter ATP-binding protein [Clostridium hydrogeniformans]
MIEAKKLRFTYIEGKDFIEDLNIKIKEGKITTIIGPNGSGKSTLLNLLCNLNKPKSGKVLLREKDIKTLKCKEISKTIATVFQNNYCPDDITVEKLVYYGRIPHKGYFEVNNEEDEEIVNWALKATKLMELRDKVVMELSGGERQRAWIAMALAQRPKVLFLDEPTTYLDIFHQIEVLDLVRELNKKYNITVVMVLHDINQAMKYSHEVIVMKNGEIVAFGEPKEIINEKLLKEVYKVQGFINLCDITGECYFIPMKVCI